MLFSEEIAVLSISYLVIVIKSYQGSGLKENLLLFFFLKRKDKFCQFTLKLVLIKHTEVGSGRPVFSFALAFTERLSRVICTYGHIIDVDNGY